MSRPPETVRLPDGRALSYYELGAPTGSPVLLFHGTPACSAGWTFADTPARETGVRALALDRPGIGQSTLQPGRRLLDWPGDIASFADALGLERFSVLGWSGGGPYAVACAHVLGDRVTVAGVAAGVCPIDWPGALEGLGSEDRLLIRLALRAPWLGQAVLAAAVAVARRWPERAAEWFLRGLPPADREAALAHTDPEDPFVAFTGAFDQGTRGPLEDYRVYGAPWGFSVEDVGVPVELWHGDVDTLVALRHAELLAECLPNARLRVLAGCGHLFPMDHARDLLAALI